MRARRGGLLDRANRITRVLGAANREALEKTHSRYFGAVSEFA
jgi:hypothetical protein